MSEIREYIRNKILETTPDADIRDGSALDDLMVSPLTSIFGPYVRNSEALINLLTLVDPESIDEGEMDHLASNFFITRSEGSLVSGSVRLYYNRPVSVDIPKNAVFTTSSGKKFFSTASYYIDKLEMANNVEGGLYHTGDILVQAENYGSSYAISANEIISASLISKVPDRVRNPRAFEGSTPRETNTQLAERIKSTFYSSTLTSPNAIKKIILSNFTGVRDVSVIGAGSPYMKRDITAVPNEFKSNFFGKRRGFSIYPDVQSTAYYKGYNAYSNVSSGTNFPNIADFEREFISYREIWNNDTSYYETQDEKEFETETFNGQNWLLSGLGSGDYVNPGWQLTDPNYGTNRYNPFAFSLVPEDNAIRLGIALDDIPEQATVSSDLAAQISELLTKIKDGYNDLADYAYITELIQQIENGTNPEVAYNYYPVFHRYIDSNAGIAITGRFKTNSTSTENTMSYITTYRTNGIIAPHDGFGIAWKVGDGSNYNLYVVDNNVLQDDIWVGPNMITQDYGINNFLQAAKTEILSDTWYNFRVEIDENHGITAWIKAESAGAIDFSESGDAANIQYGSTFSGKPISASQGSHFGLSVAGTKNKEWYYSNVGISILNDLYPIHMFKLKLEDEYFSQNDLFTVNYYGVGEAIDPGTGSVTDNSVVLYAYNHNDTVWDYLGGHDNSTTGDRLVYAASGVNVTLPYNSDYVNSNYTYIMAIADTTTQLDHKLKSYYIEAISGDGEHVGNHVDIYIDSPARIKTITENKTISNGIASFVGQGAVQEIVSVSLGGIVLDRSEWSVAYSQQGLAFSEGATIQVYSTLFTTEGATLTITYRYLDGSSAIQNLVESDDYRSPSQDNLVKVMPAYTIEFNNFIYTGDVTVSELKALFQDYINAKQTKTITVSELINFAIQNGATSVNTSDIELYVRYVDFNGIHYRQQIINSYTITGIGSFFTYGSDLFGIAQ